MVGLDCGIDAIGFQAHDWTDSKDPSRENPAIMIHALAQVVRPTGRLGIVGVFLPHDARPNDPLEAYGDIAVPWPELFRKDIAIGMGRDHDKRYMARLRDLIIAGRAKPSVVVTQRLPLADAPDAFARFDRREEGYIKIVLDLSASKP